MDAESRQGIGRKGREAKKKKGDPTVGDFRPKWSCFLGGPTEKKLWLLKLGKGGMNSLRRVGKKIS